MRPPARKLKKKKRTGTQLNATVDEAVFNELKEFCRRQDLFRDRTVEKALKMFLRSESRDEDDREFYVRLDDEAARQFQAFRRYRKYTADTRSGLVQVALSRHIATDVADPSAREGFEQELDRLHRSEPN
jgi:hypothetical protein